MKRILISLTSAIAILCSCEKPVDTSMIIGSWTEYYDDPLFIIDGSIDYTFNEDGTYHVCTYDALNGEDYSRTSTYSINGDVITLDKDESRSYTITRLDSYEMSWQKVGTTYSPGTYSTDYMHFRKSLSQE